MSAVKSPVVFGLVLDAKFIHDYAQIREHRHKGARQLGNGFTPDGRGIIIDTKRTLVRIECRHQRGVLAAPRRGITLSEIAQVQPVRGHEG